MPTIVKRGRFTMKVYAPPREHPPPHVHVFVQGAGEVVIRLPLDGKPVDVWSVAPKVRAVDVIAAVRLVEEHEAAIRAAWERMHGD